MEDSRNGRRCQARRNQGEKNEHLEVLMEERGKSSESIHLFLLPVVCSTMNFSWLERAPALISSYDFVSRTFKWKLPFCEMPNI